MLSIGMGTVVMGKTLMEPKQMQLSLMKFEALGRESACWPAVDVITPESTQTRTNGNVSLCAGSHKLPESGQRPTI